MQCTANSGFVHAALIRNRGGAVIGAGVTGLTTAYQLIDRGSAVTVPRRTFVPTHDADRATGRHAVSRRRRAA
jgi:predicted NAD/FAD-dependent oxidoreductase